MNQIYQIFQGWQRRAWPDWWLPAAIVISLQLPVAAHDLFTNYVQHSVHLIVGARHLDLTLDLIFFEEWSARERRAMDADTNGRIARSELETYVNQLAPHLYEQVKLRVAGCERQLIPLYDPEVDLMANDKIGPGHHRLRLFFFAPTPPTLRADDEIVVEDRFWPEAKVLGTVQAEGRDGCTLTTEIAIKPDLLSARPKDAQLFTFRCLKPPVENPASPRTSASSPLIPSPPPHVPPPPLPTPTTQTAP